MNKKGIIKYYDFILIDLISIVFSLLLSYYIRHLNFVSFFKNDYLGLLVVMIIVNLCIYIFYEPFNGIVKRDNLLELKKLIVQNIVSLLIVILYLFSIKNSSNYSRIVIYLTYAICTVVSFVIRTVYKKALINKSLISLKTGDKSMLILCKEREINETINFLESNNFDFYRVSGICVIDRNLKNRKINNYRVVANVNDVLEYISTNWIDVIYISTKIKYIPKIVLKGIEDSRIPIIIKLNDFIFEKTNKSIEKIGNQYVLKCFDKTISNYQIVLKRFMDIIGGLIGCAITLILIIVIGPIIYIKSPGNIFYVSNRVGKNGKIFTFYKFRSMVLDADNLKDKLKEKNKIKDGFMFKIDDDPRIIKGIGSFIRKTSLDEFPQFFNVLKGDMSLVGTRPPTLDEWNKYSPYYRSRLSIKPGITGLWQISGRSNITDFDEVVRLDNEYIDNFEIKLDIKILFETIRQIVNNNNGAL